MKPILLAEDVEDDASVIKRALKLAGVMNPIIVVPDGVEAILYLQGEGSYADRTRFPLPGVLLLDLKMPKRGGLEVLEWCRAQPHLQDMLIVILSGLHEVGLVQRAYSMGANSFLIKPCNLEDVANLTKTFPGYWEQPPPPAQAST
ncbi:MAG: putative response regulator, CheY [Pedosphaera sp.]|nr:putative response regulator, CheY [Pedosphaera sp.]